MARIAHKKHRHSATEIVRTLHNAGFVAYFAGGCVRDELLGLEPEDYDIATDARPEQVRGLFRRVDEVGASFGVMLVRHEGATVEVATFRREGHYSDRRRPDSVEYADAEADAKRRDFTINALFLDPLDTGAGGSGRVIDHVGGREDLARRVLRAVGDADARLNEDHLRALRAVRHASRLGFEIDSATADAITRHARELLGVSRERIGEEVRRMLTHPSRAIAASRLQRLGLDAPTLGEPNALCETPTLAGLGDDAPYPTALGAWALDRAAAGRRVSAARIRETAPGILDRWRTALCLSNDERAALRDVLEGVAILEQDWPSTGVAAQKRAVATPWFAQSMALVRARDAALAASVSARVEELAKIAQGIAPAPFLTGDDLVAAGFTPGPGFRAWLDVAYDAQLEGRIHDKAGALELVRRVRAQS